MSGDRWLGATIWADLESFAELKGQRLRSPFTLINVLLYPGTMSVILFRLASFFHRWYLRPISRLLYILNVMLFGAELQPSARIGPGFAMPHPVGVGISGGARLGRHVRVLGLARIGGNWGTTSQPIIGDDCWLMDGAKIFGGVVVGDGTIVAADTMVTESVPANVVVAGRPARIIRTRDPGADAPAGQVVE